jgi:hypothetical protein
MATRNVVGAAKRARTSAGSRATNCPIPTDEDELDSRKIPMTETYVPMHNRHPVPSTTNDA